MQVLEAVTFGSEEGGKGGDGGDSERQGTQRNMKRSNEAEIVLVVTAGLGVVIVDIVRLTVGGHACTWRGHGSDLEWALFSSLLSCCGIKAPSS